MQQPAAPAAAAAPAGRLAVADDQRRPRSREGPTHFESSGSKVGLGQRAGPVVDEGHPSLHDRAGDTGPVIPGRCR
jgi:hypothetical protein